MLGVPAQKKGTVPADGGGLGERMKVGLIDIDSKMPENLALMHISAAEKIDGNTTQLIKGKPMLIEFMGFDRYYASCVFSKNKSYAEYLARKGVIVGGYGVNGAKLPDKVEHLMPDYELYGLKRSIGYRTRGCIRGCPWCVVQEKEGWIHSHAPLSEFHHPDHKRMILLDGNILADKPSFKDAQEYIVQNSLQVCFLQGLDIRLVDERIAGLIADCDCRSLSFKEKRIYIAFDTPQMEKELRAGVQHFIDAGIPSGELMAYMLCGDPWNHPNGYDFSIDYHRFEILLELGVDPYVMKYNARRDIRILNHFSRWVIRRDYKRKRPKYLRPHELQELQNAISSLGVVK